MNGEFRLRVCYGKTGRLRWLSHLEVAHALERTVRRAGLPFAVTQGFSPHMKVAFGPALPVGTAGEREYFDLWLKMYTRADEVLPRLRVASPGDLAPSEAAYVADREPSLTAALTIAEYRTEVEGEEVSAKTVHGALLEVLSEGVLHVERKGKQKVFDLARSLPKEPRVTVSQGTVGVDMTVRMGPEGSLRPGQLVQAALERAGIETSAVRTTRLDSLVETGDMVWSRPV